MYRMPLLLALVAGPGLLATTACADSQSPDAGSIEERRLSPALANPRVVRWTDDHVVWVQVPARATQLMLLLPGTNGQPDNGSSVGRIAAEQGYRVIGLMYADDVAVVTACVSDPSPLCMEIFFFAYSLCALRETLLQIIANFLIILPKLLLQLLRLIRVFSTDHPLLYYCHVKCC